MTKSFDPNPTPMTDQTHTPDDSAPTERFDSDDLATDEAFAVADEPESRDEEMDRLRGEVQMAEKRVLLAQAESDNFRKRMRRDIEDQVKYAAMPIVTDVLQVRDNLLRAVEAAKNESGGKTTGLVDGVSMVIKQLDDTLAKHNIKAIPAAGELFDPNVHEAISQMPSADVAEGMIAHVAVDGFQMHERVVRPAQVIVSTGSAS